ncbi:oxidoreductase [Marinithermofilum abyssi]|uniref:Oxidoreductase n=1 Tax=Marinithermofilum abyssi TaxID=1571185 RepID=A0A8J2YAL7_9BACL|nr:2Fe-2S iron-sulfur cluster binding domain-containing protein [Marinithermofilum abyssi]GGE29689.1 oxidoreductase [Marinithermofilum abyssi]
MAYKVTFQPVGIEMEVEEGETILDAAFRQGIALMHGCKEGQCSACKSLLLDGDIELRDYSTFALPDFEKEEDHILLCRTEAFSDLEVELLQYDEEALKKSVPIKTFRTTVEEIESLTHDIRRLSLKLVEPKEITFHAGQFVDVYLPGEDVYRSYSMANPPSQSDRLEFMIKIFHGGKFSDYLDTKIQVGDTLEVRGPFGNCILNHESTGEILLVGGGSGMAPLWSILNDIVDKGIDRKVTFFYGVRSRRDLFYLDQFSRMEQRLPNFRFIPALSEPQQEDHWNGNTGLITDVMDRYLSGSNLSEAEAYLCGPAPMIDTAIPIIQNHGITSDRIFFDKFVPASN